MLNHHFSRFGIRIFLLTFFLGLFNFNCLAKNPKASPAPVPSNFLPSQFSAQFEQSFISSLTGVKKVSFGTLKYMYPGHLWFEVERPEKEKTLFVSNNIDSWFYTPPFDEKEQGEVIVRPASKLLLSGLFDSLGNGLKSNAHYRVEKKKGFFEINFIKKTAKEIGIEKVDLTFKAENNPVLGDLKSMSIHYQDGRQVQLTFSNFIPGGNLKGKDFIFHPPEKAKVQEMK